MRKQRRSPLLSAAARLGALFGIGAAIVEAQDAPRPSLSRQVSQATTVPTQYNLKAGPVLFRVSASLRTEYVDNVNLANGKNLPVESDVILSPQVGVDVNWVISKLNSLDFHTTLGYTKYLSHPELDSSNLLLSPNSILRLNVYAGDFKITFRDQFSYQEDPVGQAAVSNISKFGRFTNVAGIDVLWDLNDVIASVGYDHINLITTQATTSSGRSQDVSSLDHTVDQVSTSAFFRFTSALGGGFEATASSVRFPADARNDYTRVSIGPFMETQLTRYTKISASAGYQRSFFERGDNSTQRDGSVSSGNQSASPDNYYANLTISNRLNRYLLNQLTIGHDSQVGLFSQQTNSNYANLSARFQVASQFAISSAFSFADTDETGSFSPLVGTIGSVSYRTFGFSISTDYQITRKLTASLGYQLSTRSGSSDGNAISQNQDYTQNRVMLVLQYQF